MKNIINQTIKASQIIIGLCLENLKNNKCKNQMFYKMSVKFRVVLFKNLAQILY